MFPTKIFTGLLRRAKRFSALPFSLSLTILCVLFVVSRGHHFLAATGDILPSPETASGSLESATGSLLTETGTLLTGSGTTATGALIPEDTATGSLLTETGSLLTDTGSLLTGTGTTETATGLILDNSITDITATGSTIPSTGSLLTGTGTTATGSTDVTPTEDSPETFTRDDLVTPLEVTLLPDAPTAHSNPELLIRHSRRIQSLTDVEDSLRVTLTGSGIELPVTIEARPENDTPTAGTIVRIVTPGTFVPGTYHLTVLWNTSREEQRLLRRLLNTFTGGAEETLLEHAIDLGTKTDNGDGISSSDLLTLTRSGADLTSLLKVETMHLTVTPHRSFIGTLTEQVPPGFTVLTATSLGVIDARTDGTTITWNRRWDRETPVSLSYTFKTPLVSPLFAQFGPIRVVGMVTEGQEAEEVREVQEVQKAEEVSSVAHDEGQNASSGAVSDSSGNEARDSSRMSEEGLSSSSSIDQPSSDAAAGEKDAADHAEVSSAPGSPEDEGGAISADQSSVAGRIPRSGDEDTRAVDEDSRSGDKDLGSVDEDPRSIQESIPPSSGEESFLSSFFASLFSAQVTSASSVSFTEPRRFSLLSLPVDQAQPLPAGTLTLTPRGGNVFDANALPSFTLTSEAVTGTDILDADGNLKDAKALARVVSVLTSGDAVKQAILQTILEEKKTEIAEALSQDSATVSTIAGGEHRPQSAAQTKIEETLAASDGQAAVATALEDNAAVGTMLDALVTTKVKDAVAENAVKEALGDVPTSLIPFFAPAPPSAADAAAGSANITTDDLMQNVVDVLSQDREARKEVAQAVSEAGSDERIADSSQANSSPRSSVINVTLTDKSGRTFSPAFHFEKGSVILVLEPMREFVPGLYTLEVVITNPLTGEVTTKTQDFAWGVLAMNTDQDRYVQGDTVYTAIGVLDDLGQIVCDAQLRLVVKAPSGTKTELTTKDRTIRTTDTCGQKDSMMISPDYEATFSLAESGTYLLYLEASTKNGIRGMTSKVEVKGSGFASPPAPLPSAPTPVGRGVTVESGSNEEASPSPGKRVGGSGEGWGEVETTSKNNNTNPFIISRQAATRLYPAGKSPMTITVKFNVDFMGTVTDIVPQSFDVSRIEPNGAISGQRSADSSEKQISWTGSWKAGDTAIFSYLFDAPDLSPDFFLLGPLRLTSALPFANQ